VSQIQAVDTDAAMLFRAVNERIRELDGAKQTLSEYLCECSDAHCFSWLALSTKEFDEVLGRDDVYVIVPGHELPYEDDVVLRCERYTLVSRRR
jgi:hypothetical protein